MLVALAACTVAAPPSTSTLPTSIDLTDPDVQRQLGVPPPEDVDWRRTLEGITVVGRDTPPGPAELNLITGALQEVPPPLEAAVTPRTVVRVPAVEEASRIHPGAAAYTIGPDVYLLDRTFQISPGSSTRFDLARAYLHELAHVAQFLSLRPDYVRAALEGEVGQVSPVAGSELVADFAGATGWVDRAADDLRPDWQLSEGVPASTDYGRTGPDEDMAEAVALAALGRAEWLPGDRAAWVEGWLGATAEQLAAGKPWAPTGSQEVLSHQPLFDEQRVGELSSQYAHAEPLYFALPADVPAGQELPASITARLGRRSLHGTLERHSDDRLPRFAGLFTRSDGLAYWVELWEFREGTGFSERPDHPVLTYVVLW
jgi:hypothetical protein